MFWWLKRYLKVLRHKIPQILTDLLPKTGKFCSRSSTLSDRTDRAQFPYFEGQIRYSRILHVKSVQNTEVPYWLAALLVVCNTCNSMSKVLFQKFTVIQYPTTASILFVQCQCTWQSYSYASDEWNFECCIFLNEKFGILNKIWQNIFVRLQNDWLSNEDFFSGCAWWHQVITWTKVDKMYDAMSPHWATMG